MARVFREGELTTLYGQWTLTKGESKETQLVKKTSKSLKSKANNKELNQINNYAMLHIEQDYFYTLYKVLSILKSLSNPFLL